MRTTDGVRSLASFGYQQRVARQAFRPQLGQLSSNIDMCR